MSVTRPLNPRVNSRIAETAMLSFIGGSATLFQLYRRQGKTASMFVACEPCKNLFFHLCAQFLLAAVSGLFRACSAAFSLGVASCNHAATQPLDFSLMASAVSGSVRSFCYKASEKWMRIGWMGQSQKALMLPLTNWSYCSAPLSYFLSLLSRGDGSVML